MTVLHLDHNSPQACIDRINELSEKYEVKGVVAFMMCDTESNGAVMIPVIPSNVSNTFISAVAACANAYSTMVWQEKMMNAMLADEVH